MGARTLYLGDSVFLYTRMKIEPCVCTADAQNSLGQHCGHTILENEYYWVVKAF